MAWLDGERDSCAYEFVISITVSASIGSCDADVSLVSLSRDHVVDQMPAFGSRMLPRADVRFWLIESCIGYHEFVFGTERQ